jgi:DNA-3-methyladenine glycosylase I
MNNAGIVRNRAKIEASVTNAQAYLDMSARQPFADYLWDFVDGAPLQNSRRGMKSIPPLTPLAEKIAKDLKARGFRFCGPTIVYAFMQACGLVNDHVVDCHRHDPVAALSRPHK